jgi:hypothetical protein
MVRSAMLRDALFAALLAGAALFAVACADLKTAGDPASNADPTEGASGPGESSDDGGDASEPRQSFPPNAGPGDFGALPSGYCCTDDSECRYRHCADVGGQRMCLDQCRHDPICRRHDVMFTCDSPNGFDAGWCQPPSGFTCRPAAQFERGTRETGECCARTGDGRAGEECESNRCIALNDGPYFCTNHCTSSTECPSGYVCGPLDSCTPANRPYTCD